MSDIAKSLRAAVRMDAINGDRFERSVCANLMIEAATEIGTLRARVAELETERDRLAGVGEAMERVLSDTDASSRSDMLLLIPRIRDALADSEPDTGGVDD